MDINIRWVAEDDEVLRSFDTIDRKLGDLNDSFDDVNKAQNNTFSEIGKEANTVSNALNKSTEGVKGFSRELKEVNTTGGRFRQWLSSSVRELNVFGVNVGTTVDNLKAKQTALRGVVSGLGGATNGFKALRIAIAATGIGALVIALTSLATLLTRTQRGLDFVSRISAGLSSVFDNVIERAARLGDTLFNLFSGNIGLNQAINEAKNAFAGLGEEITNDARAAVQLERDTQNLIKSQRELRVEFANQRAEIENLRNIARDETRSYQERQAAIRQAIEIENELEQQRIANAEENLRIIRERNALGESFNVDLDAEAEAEVTLANIRAESDQRRRRDVQVLQSLQRQQSTERQQQVASEQKVIEELNNEYQKLSDTLNQRIQSSNLESLTGVERLSAEREIAVQEVERLAQELTEAATAIGQNVDVTEQVRQLIQNIDTAFQQEVDELLGRGDENGISTLPTRIEEILNEPIEPKLDIQIDSADNRSLFQKIKDDIFIGLGFSREDEELFQFISSNVQDIFSTFANSFTANIDAQLRGNQRLIDGIQQQIDETENALDRELRLREQGLANNVAVEQERLEKLQAEREKAEQQRAELEQRAARRRLLTDAASQVSSLATSAANVIKAESNKGILGLALALAGIATIFRIFSQAKALAAESVEIPTFRHGTEYVEGAGSHVSDSIPARLSKGERVVSWEHNKLLLEAGIKNADLARLAIIGKQFEAIQLPKSSISPMAIMAPFRLTEQQQFSTPNAITKDEMRQIMKEVVADEIVKAIQERPHYIPNTGKGYLEKSKKGNTVLSRKNLK